MPSCLNFDEVCFGVIVTALLNASGSNSVSACFIMSVKFQPKHFRSALRLVLPFCPVSSFILLYRERHVLLRMLLFKAAVLSDRAGLP